MNIEKQYIDGSYMQRNPDWDRADSAWKSALIIEALKGIKTSVASICEIGCGSGDILVHLREYSQSLELTGFDISPQLKSFWDEHRKMRINFRCEDFLLTQGESFDCLLLIDVIEHLENPFNFLDKIRERSKYFIFHFPLDLSAISVLRNNSLLVVRRKVGHIHYFTKDLALALLDECGYKVIEHSYTGASFNGPTRNFKTKLASVPRKILSFLDKDFSTRLIGGETLIVLAEKSKTDY